MDEVDEVDEMDEVNDIWEDEVDEDWGGEGRRWELGGVRFKVDEMEESWEGYDG